MSISLSIENLEVVYGKARSVNGISLSVETGQIIAIIGPVGAGKSTVFDAVFGLNESTGKIEFEGQDLRKIPPQKIVELGVAYAPERGNLFTQMNVHDNLMTGAYRARKDIKLNLELVYDLFPILKDRRNQETATQSGGERQMLSLGRALMSSPRLLLVDEPTIGLSPKVCLSIAAALSKLNTQHGLTILIAEQNANFALSLAEYIYLLEIGRITRHGTSAELLKEDIIRKSYFGNSNESGDNT
ncbi:MAG: ABC transporter ATP-binding protein [Gammaproteobacteria bacterium]|nr:ABC transporter ATP-binding protein [Gammaproteobacteria bacterium]